MDPLDRADQVLARARARRAGVITPDSATSPMDQTSTVRITWTTVAAADPQGVHRNVDSDDHDPGDVDSDGTVIPTAVAGRDASAHGDFGPTRPRR